MNSARPEDPREDSAAIPPESAPEVWRGFTLNAFQRQAISAIRAGKNVLVGAPTGAGKTLVAEYAIEDAVRLRRRAVYTSPIKALSNQKYRDFKAAGIDVGLQTGDVSLNPGAQVLVMTTEILRNTIFEDPRLLANVEFAIFDEVHFLDDAERGAVWEESLIFAPPTMRFTCLSATIANIRELGAWIGSIRAHPIEVIESTLRPVPLAHVVWVPGEGPIPLRDLPRARKQAQGRGKRRRGEREGRGGRGGRGDHGRGRPRRFEGPEIGPVLDDLVHNRELPVLCFCFSRKDCERLARRNAGRQLFDRGESARMAALQEELVQLFKLRPEDTGGELFSMARRGLGYHHAGMLPIDKELVERMFTSGLIKMLFTTETFALGINMPARTVLFHALKKFDGVSVDWLRTREYMQMAGRAGRQGIDREGLVISLVDPDDLAEAPLERILSGRPEPVESRFRLSYSSLLHLVSRLGRERLVEAWEKSFNAWQHREESPKSQDKNRRRQSKTALARLAFLEHLGYLEADDRLTARGRTARAINGYEVQLTELAWRGVLENLSPAGLIAVCVAQVFEDRRRGGGTYVPDRLYGALRKQVDRTLAAVAGDEARFGVAEPLKMPDWGLTPAAVAWCDGHSFDELADVTDASPGDVVRTFRMALQLLRQLRAAIDPKWDLHEALGRAMAVLDRDEIDARAQLELG